MYQLERFVEEQFQTCMHISYHKDFIHRCMLHHGSSLYSIVRLIQRQVHGIMDLFLMDGVQVLFRLSLAMLQLSKSAILSLEMESMLKYFHEELPAKIANPSRPSLFSVRLFQVHTMQE